MAHHKANQKLKWRKSQELAKSRGKSNKFPGKFTRRVYFRYYYQKSHYEELKKITQKIRFQPPIHQKKHDLKKLIPFTSISYIFRVMSNSSKLHYEDVDIKLTFFFQISTWESICFIILTDISKIKGNLQNIFFGPRI